LPNAGDPGLSVARIGLALGISLKRGQFEALERALRSLEKRGLAQLVDFDSWRRA
jgi:hypothetical protein